MTLTEFFASRISDNSSYDAEAFGHELAEAIVDYYSLDPSEDDEWLDIKLAEAGLKLEDDANELAIYWTEDNNETAHEVAETYRRIQ